MAFEQTFETFTGFAAVLDPPRRTREQRAAAEVTMAATTATRLGTSARDFSSRASAHAGRCISPEAMALVAAARRSLSEAELAVRASERYAFAHLAALRATAAMLAARARPLDASRRARPRNAWALLCEVAPEMSEWAAYFAAGAGKRAAAEAGLANAVSDREAADLLRDAAMFLALVTTTLGLPDQSRLPLPA